jgi:hypothetical protein
MIDITQVVEDAYLRRMAWTEDAFLSAMKMLHESLGCGQIEWDRGVPENWGGISNLGETLAIVCRIFPVAVYRTSVELAMKPVLDGIQVFNFSMNDWEAADFCIEPETLRKCFGLERIPESIDTKGFAVADIWYATIT